MGKVQNISGNKYGKLTVISFAGLSLDKHATWLCKCDCGVEKIIRANKLKMGYTKSCGCLLGESHLESSLKRKKSKEYRTWQHMKSRCHNPNTSGFENYGGRGIIVCAEWRNSYLTFLRDMGRSPSEYHSIDRIDNNGNYEPSNCKWATRSEQNSNTRRTRFIRYKGEEKTITQWSEELKINRTTLSRMIKKGNNPLFIPDKD